MGSLIWDHLKPRQALIEAALPANLARFASDSPAVLAEAMAYSLLAPGKRLRPLLVVLASEAAGGSIERALPAGVAVEMVHTYSLIHDDLPAMDDDDLRRGLPTCHKKFGEALAILAGDALLTLAFQVLGSSYGPAAAAVSCVELAIGAGAAGMVGGQVLDLTAEGRINGESNDLETIHRKKTGALFRSALRLGIYAAQADAPAGVDPRDLAAIDAYAEWSKLPKPIAARAPEYMTRKNMEPLRISGLPGIMDDAVKFKYIPAPLSDAQLKEALPVDALK